MNRAITLDVDPANRIASWPEAAAELLGYEPDEALGRSWVDLLAVRDAAGNRVCAQSCGMHEMVRRGEAVGVFEVVAARAEGTRLRLFGQAEPLGLEGTGGLRLTFWRDRRRGSRDRRLAEDGAKPARKRDAPPLSRREAEVLGQLSRGSRVEEVAQRLGIAVTTVRNHVQRAIAKLGATSRVEAVSLAIRRGLL